MKILLVNPPMASYYHRLGLKYPPLGVGYIAGILQREGYKVKVVDLNVETIKISSIPYQDFDVVGISTDTTRYPLAINIAKYAKAKGCKVIIGGPHTTFLDREALETGCIDYVVRGEGEYIILDLIRALEGKKDIRDVKGVSYVKEGEFIRNPNAELIKDLDALPFPARNLLPMNRYTAKLEGTYATSLVTSRGCPFNCSFCSASAFSGIEWRSRSVKNILEELNILYKKYGFKAIAFFDDNFTLNPNRVTELCEEILKLGWKFKWWAFSRVEGILNNPKMVELMAKAGNYMVFIGFESANQDVLDSFKKKLVVEKAREAINILRKNKIKVMGSFIIGAMEETKEMIQKTIDYAKRLDPDIAQFSILTPYPGTALFEEVKSRLINKNWLLYDGGHNVFRLEHLTPKEVRWLIAKAYISFYSRPKRLIKQGISSLWSMLIGYKLSKRVPLRFIEGDWCKIET
ncbi:cobalamin B12-binding domain-containing protein [bacterium]|nr:cobalamin B12-binding domain-containing protein [bacterium]